MLRPSIHRLKYPHSNPDYNKIEMGNESAEIIIRLFITPQSRYCTEFFDSIYPKLKNDILGIDEDIKLRLQPLAPAMRNKITAYSYEIQQYYNWRFNDVITFTSVEIAEFIHSVNEHYNSEKAFEFAERISNFDSDIEFTEPIVRDILSDVCEDSDSIFNDVEKGVHKPKTRYDSEFWLHSLPKKNQYISSKDNQSRDIAMNDNEDDAEDRNEDGTEMWLSASKNDLTESSTRMKSLDLPHNPMSAILWVNTEPIDVSYEQLRSAVFSTKQFI